jgi:hypothetical protein
MRRLGNLEQAEAAEEQRDDAQKQQQKHIHFLDSSLLSFGFWLTRRTSRTESAVRMHVNHHTL